MDSYFDFDQAAIPTFDLDDDLSSIHADTTQLEGNECFDSLFFDKSATLPADRTAEPETFVLKLINDREIEAVRWKYNPGTEWPMFKAKTPCSLCARMGMDCFLASRGMLITGCTACISLYRECSFTHPELPRGLIETFPGIAEDEQVCHGPATQKKAALNSYNVADARGRKSGARFHRDAKKILKTWLSEHADHPYPNERERDELKQLTGLKRSQINNWFANARRRGKVRPPSDPASPILGAVDIPTQNMLNKGYENLGPLDRWKCSPPENEPASMTAIARAVTNNNLPSASLHSSRTSSRKASSEDDSTNLSIMFQPPSVSSFETRESSNSTFSFASSRSHRSKQSFASSQDRRRRRRAPLLPQRSSSNIGAPPSANKASRPKQGQGGKERIFQCTFCTDTFPSKYDWQRHEKSLHLALERWTCCPMGSTRIDPTTGLHQCVFCPELSPTASHLEQHNFQACNEKTVAERTFYRKDHLRQHLRLMHGVKYDPHMDTWKSTTFEIKSRCGFCPSIFNTWQARADHLAAHFRNGTDMKDWSGGWGFEGFVERLVENAIPPYLIGHERNTMDPYRAREVQPSPKSKLSSPSNTSPTDRTNTTNCSSDAFPESDLSSGDRIEVDQRTKDSNCWHRLEEELIKYVLDQKTKGIIPHDKQIQDHARVVIYGDPDPWDWTMADNPIWLDAFKCEHGITEAPRESTEGSSPEYRNTRAVPVAAPYVIKGGLKSNLKRLPTDGGPCNESVGHRTSVSSLPGVQKRSCPPLQSTNSSYCGGTPLTPVENLFNFEGNVIQGPIDAQQMDLDFDAIDFNQLDLNAFAEMEFESELSTSVPVTAGGMMDISFGSGAGTGMSQTGMGQQKPLPAAVNPFANVDDATEMSLEVFDQ